MTGFVPRKFRERSAVVEAVQLTDDADWDAIAVWCRGVHRVDFDVTGEACSRIVVPGSIADAYAGDWIAASYDSRWCEPFVVFTSSDPDQDFEERFEPAAEAESVGARLDAVLAELASIVTAEYASDAPRERVVQRIASAASTLAACRQESDLWEIAPDRLAGVRDAVRAGREGR